MSLSNALVQVKCALTQHEVKIEDEDRLFEEDIAELPIFCKKCKAPLTIRRLKNENDVYYIKERSSREFA